MITNLNEYRKLIKEAKANEAIGGWGPRIKDVKELVPGKKYKISGGLGATTVTYRGEEGGKFVFDNTVKIKDAFDPQMFIKSAKEVLNDGVYVLEEETNENNMATSEWVFAGKMDVLQADHDENTPSTMYVNNNTEVTISVYCLDGKWFFHVENPVAENPNVFEEESFESAIKALAIYVKNNEIEYVNAEGEVAKMDAYGAVKESGNSVNEEKTDEEYTEEYINKKGLVKGLFANKNDMEAHVEAYFQGALDEFVKTHGIEAPCKLRLRDIRNQKYVGFTSEQITDESLMGVFKHGIKYFTINTFNESHLEGIEHNGEFYCSPSLWMTLSISYYVKEGGSNGIHYEFKNGDAFDNALFYFFADKKIYTREESKNKK